MRGHGRPIADLYGRVRLLARTNALDEIGHVIHVWCAPFGCRAIGAIYFLREIPDTGLRFTGYHISRARQTFDCAVRAEETLTQTVVTVAES